MRFDQQFVVDATPEAVWDFLTDVPRMAGCIPGAGAPQEIDDQTYDTVVTAKIGPISARFACRVAIVDLDREKQSGVVEVSGKDVKLGGGVKARSQLQLSGSGPTTVTTESDVEVLGKIGQYGHGMVAKRADAMLESFADCFRARVVESTT
jgi:carbon monoxide dehydrogenase subunit G